MDARPFFTPEEFADLPDDPVDAFVKFEGIVRARFQEDWNRTENNDALFLFRKYARAVRGVADGCGIDEITRLEIPSVFNENENLLLMTFMDEVVEVSSRLGFNSSRRRKVNSVTLNKEAKAKIHDLLSEIRDSVGTLNVSAAKREELFVKINEFQSAVDCVRTTYEAYAAFAVGVFKTVGDCADPIVDRVVRLGACLGWAQDNEQSQPQLPSPPKRIEDRRPKEPKSGGNRGGPGDLDDEIPF